MAFARVKVWWVKMDAVKLVTEGPPEGKEHRTPERYFTKSKSWLVVGFCPRVTSTGVFGINQNTLYPNFWSFKEVFSATN